MAEESDGIEEALTGSVRVAVTIGARMGEILARAREERMRHAEATEQQHAHELTARLHAEQAAARADLAPVFRTEWWDQASPNDIQHVHTTARAWTDQDREAHRAAARIRDEVRSRYDVDVDSAGAGAELVRITLERTEARRAEADHEHTRSSKEQLEAQLLVVGADGADQAAEGARAAAQHEPDLAVRQESAVQAKGGQARAVATDESGKNAYDTAERRRSLVANLERRGIDQDTIAARMTADVSYSTHPSEAVKVSRKKAPKARKNNGNKQLQHERSR